MRQEENLGGVLNIIYLPARKRMSRRQQVTSKICGVTQTRERERESLLGCSPWGHMELGTTW